MAPTSRSRSSAPSRPKHVRDAFTPSPAEDGAPTSTPGGPARATLSYSGIPGVYLNGCGAHVDSRGILLSWSEVRAKERDLDTELIGEPADTPAKFLKRVAMDNRIPLSMRLDAAQRAAPYFDSKMPLKFEGGAVVGGLDLSALANLPRDKRVQLLDLLREIGVKFELPSEPTSGA